MSQSMRTFYSLCIQYCFLVLIKLTPNFHSWEMCLFLAEIVVLQEGKSRLYPVTQRSREPLCLTESCSLTPFSPRDGWIILYTINPSICQLLMEILGLRVVGGQVSGMPPCITADCNYRSRPKSNGNARNTKRCDGWWFETRLSAAFGIHFGFRAADMIAWAPYIVLFYNKHSLQDKWFPDGTLLRKLHSVSTREHRI